MKNSLIAICFIFLVNSSCLAITATEANYNQKRIDKFCTMEPGSFNDSASYGNYKSQQCLQALNNKILLDIYNQLLKQNKKRQG